MSLRTLLNSIYSIFETLFRILFLTLRFILRGFEEIFMFLIRISQIALNQKKILLLTGCLMIVIAGIILADYLSKKSLEPIEYVWIIIKATVLVLIPIAILTYALVKIKFK
jgi:hypothetical protein